MSIDPGILKRLLYLRIVVEGNASWAFRELLDQVAEIIEERLPIVLNEAVETYGLETSVLNTSGCDVFPEEKACNNIIVVGVYEKESTTPLVYAGYILLRGENTLEFKFLKAKDASTNEPI